MCAYFFKVSHPVLNNFNSPAHKELKDMVTSPLFQQLPESVRTDIKYKFDKNNPDHQAILRDCTRIAKEKLLDCKATDKEAASALMLGIVAQATGFLPFNWIITPLAFMYSGYLIKERIPAYEEYTESLETLHRCAAWALNNSYTTADDMNNEAVQAMLNVLKEVMTKEQLKDIIVDGGLENDFLASIDDELDAEKQQNFEYKIYGYKQGGSLTAIATQIGIYVHKALNEFAVMCLDFARNNPAPQR